MAITLRGTKGSALTHSELDTNFTTLVSNDYSTYTTLTSLINTVQGNLIANTASINANTYNTYITVEANTYNTYVTVEANTYNTYTVLTGLIDTVQDNVTASLSPVLSLNRFNYIANANQTVFNGPDIDNQTMFFNANTTQVYMNGFLLRSSNDYVLTANSNTVTLQLGAIANSELTITSLSIS